MSAFVYLSEICRLLIFFVLLFAAWGKTNTFSQFRQNLVESFKIRENLSKYVALIIIGSEWLLAAYIIINSIHVNFAMLTALLIFILFTFVIAVALVQDKIISCNCFGRAEQKISVYDLLRNLILIVACSYYLVFQQDLFQPGIQSIDIIPRLLLSGVAFILFQISTNLNEIAILVRFQDRMGG